MSPDAVAPGIFLWLPFLRFRYGSRRAIPISDSLNNGSGDLTVVAVGPGDPALLTLAGRDALRGADLAVGFATVLEVARPWLDHAEVRPMTYRNQEEVLDYAAGQVQAGQRCVVCCWGDLNVSARELLARVRRRFGSVRLIPGISSVQAAMARAGISLEDSVFITLHRRATPADELAEAMHYINEARRHIILLPRPYDLMPAAIAAGLLAAGAPADLPTLVYQCLTLDAETQWRGTLRQCRQIAAEFSDLSLMVFLSGETPAAA